MEVSDTGDVNKKRYSDQMANRRKALFPSKGGDNELEDDLGYMSPINDDFTEIDNYMLRRFIDDKSQTKKYANMHLKNCKNLNGERALHVNNKETPKTIYSYQSSETMSPLLVSPLKQQDSSFHVATDDEFTVLESPEKSPSERQKTPHYTVNSELPKLIRKSIDGALKHSASKSVNSEGSNLSTKGSKVRTALFPDDGVTLPPKSFYPKIDGNTQKRVIKKCSSGAKSYGRKNTTTFLCNRKTRTKNRNGLINAGVQHKIRKPKGKPTASVSFLKATLNIIRNSPLNIYFDSMKKKENTTSKENESNNVISKNQLLKMDNILKEADKTLNIINKPKDVNKMEPIINISKKRRRSRSPSPIANRKFFKSAKRTSVVTINNLKLAVSDGKYFSLINKGDSKSVKNEFLDDSDPSDFIIDDDLDQSIPIDNILSTLENDKENLKALNDPSQTIDAELFPDSLSTVNVESQHLNQISPQFQAGSQEFLGNLEQYQVDPQQICTNQVFSSQVKQNHTQFIQNSNVLQPTNPLLNVPEPNSNILLSPTTQMCDMASGLAISSPKRAVLNINKLLGLTPHNPGEGTQDVNSSTSVDMEQKMFPIFYPNQQKQQKSVATSQPSNSNMKAGKQWKSTSKNQDQMLLDAGQKRFGVTQCPECSIVYHIGDPGDELMHLNYHNSGHILRFNGWRHEHVVSNSSEGRIIRIVPGDPKTWWKKAKELMEVVNRDLGFYDMQLNMENCQVYLYITNKTIVGCTVAETKTSGFELLSSDGVDVCSEAARPIKCGVSRIWVSQNHRNKGVGTAMMNCLKLNFIHGYILSNSEIALSSPTELGKLFARNYFKTPNFLIYTS